MRSSNYPFNPELEEHEILIDISDAKAVKKTINWLCENIPLVEELAKEDEELEFGTMEGETFKSFYFFGELTKKVEYQPLLLQYLEAIGFDKWVENSYGSQSLMGMDIVYALADHDEKYIPTYLNFQRNSNFEHNEDWDFSFDLVEKWKIKGESITLLAALCGSICTQNTMENCHGLFEEFELIIDGEEVDYPQLNRFFNHLLLDLQHHQLRPTSIIDTFFLSTLEYLEVRYSEDLDDFVIDCWMPSFLELLEKIKPEKELDLNGFLYASEISLEGSAPEDTTPLIPEFYPSYLKWAEYWLLENDFERAEQFMNLLELKTGTEADQIMVLYIKSIVGKINQKNTSEIQNKFEELYKNNTQSKTLFNSIELWAATATISDEIKSFIDQLAPETISTEIDRFFYHPQSTRPWAPDHGAVRTSGKELLLDEDAHTKPRRSETLDFPNAEVCQLEAEKLVSQYLEEGYIEIPNLKQHKLFLKALQTSNADTVKELIAKGIQLDKCVKDTTQLSNNNRQIYREEKKFIEACFQVKKFDLWKFLIDELLGKYDLKEKDYGQLLFNTLKRKSKSVKWHEESVQYLLKSSYQLQKEEYRNSIGWLSRLSPETAALFLKKCDWKTLDKGEFTTAAAGSNNIPLMEFLLENGLPIENRPQVLGALHEALKNSWELPIIKKLVENGANPKYESWDYILQETGKINQEVKDYLEKQANKK